MELGVYGTPGWAYTMSVPDQHFLQPGEQHTLALYTKYVTARGQPLLIKHKRDDLLLDLVCLPRVR